MRFYDSSTTTSSYTYYTGTADYMVGFNDVQPTLKKKKSKGKENKLDMIKSIPLRYIMEMGILTGNISVFSYRDSPVFRDAANIMGKFGISTYCNDPVIKGYDRPTNAGSYNYSLIIDALEYMPGTLTRANLVKEAFYTLSLNVQHPSIIIVAKSPKMVNNMAERGNYKKLDDGFLIPEDVDDKWLPAGRPIEGLTVDDLTKLAVLAGSVRVEEVLLEGTEESCIRAFLN